MLTNAEFTVRRASSAIETTKEKLIKTAEWIARDMETVADKLRHWDHTTDANSFDCTPINSLGELQGQGRELDRLCAVLDQQFKTYREIRRLIEKGE